MAIDKNVFYSKLIQNFNAVGVKINNTHALNPSNLGITVSTADAWKLNEVKSNEVEVLIGFVEDVIVSAYFVDGSKPTNDGRNRVRFNVVSDITETISGVKVKDAKFWTTKYLK